MSDPDNAWFDTEVRARVEAIETPGYDLGQRFSAVSWVVAIGVVVACLISIFVV
ncbi:hypothetical protein [Microbacterium sp. NPDC055357]